jgi:hypothetical protein
MILASESPTSTMSMSASIESAHFARSVIVISHVPEYRPLAVVWNAAFSSLQLASLKRLTDLTNLGVEIRQAGQTFGLMHVTLRC